ncbi:MAG: hypothetical protein NDJ94_11740 [Vicinamibacteria bacterium]|nr:hypothetical protein [Vicinamibacteria bacterium]
MRLLVLTLLLVAPLAADAPPGADPRALWEGWADTRFVTTSAPCLKPADLQEQLRALAAKHAGALKLEEVGRSFQGRPISMLTVGRGPRKVMLWSQMHGDEPSATPALLDLADFLLSRQDDPVARRILDGSTLYLVPMLNPDGSETYERRNGQGIDINRDALNLATPEGQLLKALRDRLQPDLGFNLHDQNRRTAVGDSGQLASIAVLGVAGDQALTMTPGRARAIRACAAISRTLHEFIPGAIARYDEDWSPRAFGDNLTAWGTPVVLIESGAVPAGMAFHDLTRLNFVALLATLHDLVADDLAGHDAAIYERLPRNQTGAWADRIAHGALVWHPRAGAPTRADLAFDIRRSDRERAGCAAPRPVSTLVEVGDARFLGGQRLDLAGAEIAPPLVASADAAAAWLDEAALARLARLGVGTLRLHGEPSLAVLRALDAGRRGGTVALVRVGADAPRAWLDLREAPRAPASRTLGDLADALGGPAWREAARGLDDGALVARLTTGARFLPGTPASFMVLRRAPGGDLTTTTVERIVLDGLEPGVQP